MYDLLKKLRESERLRERGRESLSRVMFAILFFADDEDGVERDPDVVRSTKKTQKARPDSLANIGDVKSKFEQEEGHERRERMRLERKGEMAKLRGMICGVRYLFGRQNSISVPHIQTVFSHFQCKEQCYLNYMLCRKHFVHLVWDLE